MSEYPHNNFFGKISFGLARTAKGLARSATAKGFTIIELIVVIAIIAVLAAVVLVNVTTYIAKGKNAAIKGTMSSMATIAAGYYDNNSSSFIGLLTTEPFAVGIIAIDSANGSNNVTSNVIATAWCVQSALNGGGSWCVDYSGYKGTTANCDATNANCQ